MPLTQRALVFASRWFDGTTVRNTFEPLIADWQREWTRASIAILPVLFIWLRWGDLSRPRRKWYSPLPSGLATIAAIAAYLALWFVGVAVEIERVLPYSLGRWVPTFGLIALGLAARRRTARCSEMNAA